MFRRITADDGRGCHEKQVTGAAGDPGGDFGGSRTRRSGRQQPARRRRPARENGSTPRRLPSHTEVSAWPAARPGAGSRPARGRRRRRRRRRIQGDADHFDAVAPWSRRSRPAPASPRGRVRTACPVVRAARPGRAAAAAWPPRRSGRRRRRQRAPRSGSTTMPGGGAAGRHGATAGRRTGASTPATSAGSRSPTAASSHFSAGAGERRRAHDRLGQHGAGAGSPPAG